MGAHGCRWNVTQSAQSRCICFCIVLAIGVLVKILVDVEEQRSLVPSFLETLGAAIEITRLPVGDYRIAADSAVERKTVGDLHRSLVSGMLWSQLFALKRATGRSYFLVEGRNLDAGRVSPRGVRGALLGVAGSGIAVVRTVDSADTALWVYLMARRDQAVQGGATLRGRGRRRMVVSASGVIATVPGLSPALANRLLSRFGSIADIAKATESELREVPGIGPARAASLHRVLSSRTH